MKIINLTPHALHIRRANGTDIEIQPCGIVPRLDVSRAECAPVVCEDGVEIAVSRVTFGARHVRINGCLKCARGPIAADDNKDLIPIAFVVSTLCAQSPELAGRTDVYAPGEALRDSAGKIIGANGLSRINPLASAR
jgi:hypothetical protein